MNVTEKQEDALKEVINIGIGEAVGILNEILNRHIILHIPELKILTIESIKEELQLILETDQFSSVELEFFGTVKGNAQLIFSPESAIKLVSIITDEQIEADELNIDELKIGALTEIGNIVLSSVMGSISNLLSQNLEYFLPSYFEGNINDFSARKNIYNYGNLIMAQTHFEIENTNIIGDILIIFRLSSFYKILEMLETLTGG